jgi:esterase
MAAQLYTERIVHGSDTTVRWLAMTHGIYGSGANWRGIARKLVERRPEWGVVLVDLRGHGRSQPGAPPHTLAACAEDLVAAVPDVDAISGHSFGGKVALATRALRAVRQTWVLDASPSARPDALADPANSVTRVLALMERLPRTWARREDFVSAIVADGQPLVLAQWLAMNVVPEDGAYRLRLDLAQMRALLADYYARDLWSALDDPRGGDVQIVIAERAATVSADDRARLASAPAHVQVTYVDAGHWLNVEAPAAIVELFAARLP